MADSSKTDVQESLRDTLEKVFAAKSNKAAVFMSDNGDGTITALWARGTAEDGDAMTFHVDGRVFAPVMMGAVAAGLGTSTDSLKKEKFHDMIANSVGAAACSGTPIPGVHAIGFTTGPIILRCQAFVAQHPIEEVKAVSIKQIKNIAWRYREATKPKDEKKKKDASELLF